MSHLHPSAAHSAWLQLRERVPHFDVAICASLALPALNALLQFLAFNPHVKTDCVTFGSVSSRSCACPASPQARDWPVCVLALGGSPLRCFRIIGRNVLCQMAKKMCFFPRVLPWTVLLSQSAARGINLLFPRATFQIQHPPLRYNTSELSGSSLRNASREKKTWTFFASPKNTKSDLPLNGSSKLASVK